MHGFKVSCQCTDLQYLRLKFQWHYETPSVGASMMLSNTVYHWKICYLFTSDLQSVIPLLTNMTIRSENNNEYGTNPLRYRLLHAHLLAFQCAKDIATLRAIFAKNKAQKDGPCYESPCRLSAGSERCRNLCRPIRLSITYWCLQWGCWKPQSVCKPMMAFCCNSFGMAFYRTTCFHAPSPKRMRGTKRGARRRIELIKGSLAIRTTCRLVDRRF